MTFDLTTVTALVRRLADTLLPGWTLTCELAPSIEENANALAMVFTTPERQMAHVVVAPHPPGESLEESVAHELTHAVLSPLTALVECSAASIMIEEQIVERLGKVLAKAPIGLARAVSRALANPRSASPTMRKRISALATRRRTEERKRSMPNPKKLAELAMKAGELGAREDVPEDVRALLAEFVAEMAGGGAESEPPVSREEEPMATEPQMREDEMPAQMREQYRMATRAASMLLGDTIRLRLHTARTVDRIELDSETEKDLAACKTLDEFEGKFRLVKRIAAGATEQRRSRSGVKPDASDVNGAPSLEAMVSEGIPEAVASHVRNEFARGKEHGQTALNTARRYRKGASNG